MSGGAWLLVAAAVVVAIAVALGLRAAGTPADARLDLLDQRRVEDLRAIAAVIGARGVASDSAVAQAAALELDRVRDPETGARYGFRARPGDGFELGATFQTARRSEDLEPYERAWAHGAGEWWFVFAPPSGPGVPLTGHAGAGKR